MKKAVKKSYSIQSAAFYVFLFLLISVPMLFWKGFDNGFDLVKSSVLKIAGGAFLILSSIYLMSVNTKKPDADIYYDKTLDPMMLFFLLSIILSVLFSVNVYLSIWGNYETQIGALIYLILFIIYFLLPSIIIAEKKLKVTFRLVEVITLIIALFTIIEYFGVNPFNLKPADFHRPVSPIGHPVFSAGFMILLLPFSVLNISDKKSKIIRVVVPIIILSGIIVTQTRSAYAALAVQIIIFAVLYPILKKSGKLSSKKYLIYSSVFLFAVILFIFLLIIFFPENIFVKRFLSIRSITYLPRWFLWKDSIVMFFHYPITGTGISAFSNVFENYASYQLKYAEIKGLFLNAHSNFLNTFCTMGIIGGIAYTLILIQVMRVSLKNTFSSKNSPQIKIFFFAFFGSIAGYAVYGIADFDEITILLYLFVILSLFKIKNIKVSSPVSNIKKFKFSSSTKLAAGLLFIIFAVYSIYSGYIDLYAQNIYSAGLEKYKAQNINGYINDVNAVVELNPNESYYRYKFASDLLVYSSGLNKNSTETKKSLLERAREEIIKADKNHRSHLECLAVRSLIELELGNEAEGFRVKDELFKKDTTQFPYRTNLAVYYLNRDNDSAAIYEINSILSWDFKNIRILALKVYYLQRKDLKDEAIETCRKILEIEPNNQYAKNTLQQLEKK